MCPESPPLKGTRGLVTKKSLEVVKGPPTPTSKVSFRCLAFEARPKVTKTVGTTNGSVQGLFETDLGLRLSDSRDNGPGGVVGLVVWSPKGPRLTGRDPSSGLESFHDGEVGDTDTLRTRLRVSCSRVETPTLRVIPVPMSLEVPVVRVGTVTGLLL